mmetsp:Transcript_17701/g.47057  ORF Transcript_17701/g.47057 Transcript_17701/m.47057 type:complete len:167 (-) Transcript_17701:805-1305(-)
MREEGEGAEEETNLGRMSTGEDGECEQNEKLGEVEERFEGAEEWEMGEGWRRGRIRPRARRETGGRRMSKGNGSGSRAISSSKRVIQNHRRLAQRTALGTNAPTTVISSHSAKMAHTRDRMAGEPAIWLALPRHRAALFRGLMATETPVRLPPMSAVVASREIFQS